MRMDSLYRIEELFTDGWALIEEDAQQLTKEQCDQLLDYYVASGINPKHLRAVRES